MVGTKLIKNPLEYPPYQRFAHRVAEGATISGAARELQISMAKAGRLMRDPRILAYVQDVRAKFAEELEITRDDVVRGMLEAVQDARTLGDPSTQVRGWAEIGKICGHYAPEQHHHHFSGAIEKIERSIHTMTTDELMRLAEHVGEVYEEGEGWPDESTPTETGPETSAEISLPNDVLNAEKPARSRSSRGKTGSSTTGATSASSAKRQRKSTASRSRSTSASSSGPSSGAGAKRAKRSRNTAS